MILGIDIGNTTISLSLIDEDIVYNRKTDTFVQEDYRELFDSFFRDAEISKCRVERVVISCVVRPVVDKMADSAARYFGWEPLVVSPYIETGLVFDIENVESLGSDRIVVASYAASRYGSFVITVDCGTATTFNVIADNHFKGGVIATGIMTGLRALLDNTSQLPETEIIPAASVVGKNTVECINNGVIYANAAMIDGIAGRIEAEYGKEFSLVLTGGNARFVQDYIKHPLIVDLNMIQKGMARLAVINN